MKFVIIMVHVISHVVGNNMTALKVPDMELYPYNPTPLSLPHQGEIPGAVDVGTVIYVTGVPFKDVTNTGFFINLQCGPKSSDNTIGFHMNARFEERIIIRNSRIGPDWGKEERNVPRFIFAPSTEFQLRIRVLQDRYCIDVGEELFAEYTHRFKELSDIKTIYIAGEVDIHRLVISKNLMN
ncbi:PREDICTED: galectin-5-like [Priapulus caudatus]|uniref:Galectin n=1 Tax=Priapulus caudatus TaxID=37621 RepID=A0ABM1DYM9_PRICU|nr:PREDICTED: galectin-5-like [Priapulus caudatus]